MTHAPEPTFPPSAAVSLASIQREYLEDLKCRVSPGHYKNVKARLDRLATALQISDLQQLRRTRVELAPITRWNSPQVTRTVKIRFVIAGGQPSGLGCGGSHPTFSTASSRPRPRRGSAAA